MFKNYDPQVNVQEQIKEQDPRHRDVLQTSMNLALSPCGKSSSALNYQSWARNIHWKCVTKSFAALAMSYAHWITCCVTNFGSRVCECEERWPRHSFCSRPALLTSWRSAPCTPVEHRVCVRKAIFRKMSWLLNLRGKKTITIKYSKFNKNELPCQYVWYIQNDYLKLKEKCYQAVN